MSRLYQPSWVPGNMESQNSRDLAMTIPSHEFEELASTVRGKVMVSPHESSERRSHKRTRSERLMSNKLVCAEDVVKLSLDSHSTGFWAGLYDMYQDSMFCDISLKVGEACIQAHRIVLTAQCTVLKSMFTIDMAERNQSVVNLSHLVDLKNLRLLLEYMYTGEVKAEASELQDLLLAADALGVMGCYHACVQFLEDQLDVANCLDFLSYAERIGCLALKDSALTLAVSSLSVIFVSNLSQFLEAAEDIVGMILSDVRLEVDAEVEVWRYLKAWLLAAPESRRAAAGRLVARCIRLHNMSSEDRTHIVDTISTESPELNKALGIALNFIGAGDDVKEGMLSSGEVLKKRNQRLKSSLWCVGGTDNFRFRDTVLKFSLESGDWEEKSALKKPRCGFGVAQLNGFLYAIGGKSSSAGKSMDSVERYNMEKDEWEDVAPLNTPRRYHGVAVLNGLIYAVGGGNGAETLKSVEVYDPERNTWSYCAPLKEGRKCVSVAVVNGKVYAVGGFSQRTLQSVEAYDPEADAWEKKCSLNVKRQFHGCCVLNGLIYAIGGNGNGGRVPADGDHSVERYDPVTDKWMESPPMKISRSFLGVAVMDGCIYTVGGHGQHSGNQLDAQDHAVQKIMMSVERFDADTEEWTVLDTKLPEPRSAAGCVGLK